MKGISALVSSVLLIVTVIGITAAIIPSISKQSTETLSDAKKQSLVTVDCAQTHFDIASVFSSNGELSITMRNTGQKALGNFSLYASLPGRLQSIPHTRVGSISQGSVFKLNNNTFPYTFTDKIVIVSSECPNAKYEHSAEDPSLALYLSFDGDTKDRSKHKSDGVSYVGGYSRLILSFDDGSGSIAADGSGNQIQATLGNGPVWESGCISNGCLSFDGINDRVSISNESFFDLSQFAVEAWVLPDTFTMAGTRPRTVISKEQFSVGNSDWALQFTTSGQPQFEVADSLDARTQITSSVSVSAGRWQHLVATRENNKLRLYLNGTLVASTDSAPLTPNNSSATMYVGTIDSGVSGHFDGKIDEVAIHSRVLTAEEAQARYALQQAQRIAYTSGAHGQALFFDGFNDYVKASSTPLEMSNAVTMSAWIKPYGAGRGVGGAGGIIINKEGEYEYARFSNGFIHLALAISSPGWAWMNTSYNVPLNTLVHLVTTYSADDQVVRLYANGTLVFSNTTNGTIGDQHPLEEELWIGSRQWQGDVSYFNGTIDEPRVYSRALKDYEVRALYEEYSS